MKPTFEPMSIDNISLDKRNPRLPSNIQGGSELDIIEYLAIKTRLEDLMASIGENDFFEGEAIVVTKEEGKLVVLEGNRRLAALKLLRDPSLVGRKKFETIARQAKHKPEQVPVYLVESRSNALNYIGFRHISGVQRWDPLSKARYLKTLLENTDPDKDVTDRYRDVAREIGGKVNSVQRSLDALAAYERIEQEGFFGVEDLDEDSFQFGTFYTAIGNSNIAKFIGLRGEENETINGAILDSSCLISEQLKELTVWMFEKKADGSTKLGESRNIPDFGEVLANPEGVSALRMGLSIAVAKEKMGGSRTEFLKDIVLATDHLQQANRNLHVVSGDDSEVVRKVQEAEDVLKVTTNHLFNRQNG